MSLHELMQWLNNTRWSTALRSGDNAFPFIESIHIVALAFSVGTIMMVDLRLMGIAFRHVRASEIIRHLEPWAIRGFGVMLMSGAMLFLAEPEKAYETIAFRIKMVLLLAAGMNVWLFHKGIFRTIDSWDESEVVPWRAKLAGYFSLLLWLGVIVCGRWTAYF